LIDVHPVGLRVVIVFSPELAEIWQHFSKELKSCVRKAKEHIR